MDQQARGRPEWLDWGAAARPLTGETVSGDRYLMRTLPESAVVAVVDGLGHGPEAAVAAEAALAALNENIEAPPLELVRRCHAALRQTRGVVMSLASITKGGLMDWLGIGDVEGLLFRADAAAVPPREALLLRGGVVGYQLPPLRDSTLPLGRGDVLVFATDGIRRNFVEGIDLSLSPQQLADHILTHYSKGTDDALVLAVRYLGRTA